ncbi:DUF4400 domain-containing protein [Vibrio sp.]|uniref:DUF4400 domain-containing protein n=1 Tax=Vibrio sp. TaxID=678 RepID=UPI003D0F5D0A
MAEQQVRQESKPAEKKNPTQIPVLSWAAKILSKVLSISFLAGFICLLIEFGMYFFVDNPVEQSYQRYQAIASFSTTGTWFDEQKVMNMTEKLLLEKLDTKAFINKITVYSRALSANLSKRSHNNPYVAKAMDYTQKAIAAFPELVSIWLITTFTWLAKMLTIIAMLLPCALIIIGGVVDGSVERKINTFKGKRDSQDKIEWWFLAFKSSSYTALFLYVAIPNSFQATVVLLPSAVATAFFARNILANYKKYF